MTQFPHSNPLSRNVLIDLDERLRSCFGLPITAEEAYDSDYQASVAEALSGRAAKYDDTLLPFLANMRHELHQNSGKGDRPGWLTMSRDTALLEIYWHTAKLSAAVKNNDAALIREHSADVANMAMMLADVCGLFAAAPQGGDTGAPS